MRESRAGAVAAGRCAQHRDLGDRDPQGRADGAPGRAHGTGKRLTIPDAGFMECFMGGDLVYRGYEEVLDLAEEIPTEQIGDVRVFGEENRALWFLEVTKRG